ncbi:MAG: T9SS type A sorting domain-containing protein, partial [Candidatus Latescibacteria bacterium]|nr:T9SS type A sorting domain-containing protein [Candidatus Latescibacterota bacterium]
PGTIYQIRVYIEDVSENEAESELIPFRTRDTPDTSPPTVRSIQVDPKTRATFTVITSEPAKVTIYLMLQGTAPVSKRLDDDEYIIVSSNDFRRVSELIQGGFIEGATYQFHVEAEDQSGNVGVSRPRSFTVRAPDTTPPVILYSVILQNGGRYAVLGIGTDERTIARVDYAPANDPTDISTVFSTLVRNFHIVIITNLVLDTEYQFTFTVIDQSNNSTSSNPTVSARQIAEMVEDRTLFKVLQGPGQTGRFTTNQSPDTQAPVILNGPTIVAQSSDALTVQWETDELSSSIVEYGEGNFNDTESLSDNVTTHTVTLNGLSSSTTYQYRISSQDPTGNGPTLGPAPLNVAAATTTIESDISPPQISNVQEASVTNDRAVISFSTDEPGDGFVEFDTDMSTFGQSLGSTTLETDHTVTLTNLTAGTTYYYRAISTDANGNGPGFSATGSFITALVADNTDPVVSNLSVRPGFRYAVITWDTDEVSNSFVQMVDGSGDTLSVATIDLKTSHSVTIADTTFLPGSANLFTVIAGSTDPSGNTGESNKQFTTLAEADTTAPEIPSGITAEAGNGVVSLTWADISDPDFGGFLIFRILSGDTTQVATGVTGTSYLDESVSNDSSYTYFLQSVDTAIPAPNISESSATVDVTPASGAEPTAPSAVSPVDSANVSLKPILLVNDATPGTSGGTLSYTFAVYSDSALTQLVASIAGIPQGTPTNPTHWQVIDPALSDSVVLSTEVKYWWRTRANNGTFDGAWSPVETFIASDQVPLAVEEVADANVPKSHALSQNFPNPFNPSTRIQFALPKPGLVSITIYNVLGQEVRRLVNDQSYTTGFHYVTWDGRNGANQTTSSGVYLYRLEVKDGVSQERVYQQAKKMLLIK